VLQHKAIQFMAKFFDATLAHTSRSRMEVSEQGYPQSKRFQNGAHPVGEVEQTL
jgi:hypothetical protein